MRSSSLLIGFASVALLATTACERQSAPDTPSTVPSAPPSAGSAALDTGDYLPPGPETPLPPRIERIRSDLGEYAALIRVGRFGPARIRLKQHLEDHPEDGQAKFLFGLSQYLEAQYARAQPHLEQAARLEPGYFVTFANLGWCYYYLADLDRAAACFRHFLRFEPAGVARGNAHFALGIIALDRSRDEPAETHLLEAIEAFTSAGDAAVTDRGKAHARLGELYLRNDRFEEARQELSQAIVMWPEHYDAHFMLYRTLLRLGEEEQAAAALQRYEEAKAAFEQSRNSVPPPP